MKLRANNVKNEDYPLAEKYKDNSSSGPLNKYKLKIYIIIPAYNESKVIESVIQGLKERNLNIIIVDDGSSDKTFEISRKSLEKYNGFIYRHSLNRGVGAALKTGIVAALRKNADLIVTFDADGQHDPEDINNMLKPLIKGEVDLVNGYRNFKEMPTSKKLGNQIMNIVTLVFYGIHVKDSQSGFKAFNRKAANVFEIHSRGFGVISEIMGEVKRHNLRFKEVPVKTIYTDYSRSKGTNLKEGLKILFKLIINIFKRVLS